MIIPSEGCWKDENGTIVRHAEGDHGLPFEFWSNDQWYGTVVPGAYSWTPCDDPSKPEFCHKCGRAAVEHSGWSAQESLKHVKAIVDEQVASYRESKDRLHEATGRKHDDGKPNWALLPVTAMAKIVDVLTLGAKKYDADNWQHVTQFKNRYYSALQRHMNAWRSGELLDPDSGLRHLAHAACCVLFLLEMEVGDFDVLLQERQEQEEQEDK